MKPYTAGERRQGAIKLSSNENPRGCSPEAAAAIRESIAEVHIYPDGAARALKTALADTHGVTQDQIVLGNGSDEVMTMIAATYLNPGESVHVGEHTFSQYAFAARLFDGVVRHVPMPDLTFDPVRILPMIDRTVRLLFLCTPNNPTGLSISRADLERLLREVPRDVLVVVDHAYIDYQEDPQACDALEYIAQYPNLVALRTFSKAHGLAALRVGYGIAGSERIREIERVRSPFNVSTLGQNAAIASLEASAFVRESSELNRAGKQRMMELFRSLEIEFLPSQANFLTIRVTGEAQEFAREIASRGITVRPLNSFGLPDQVRITIGTPEQIDLLENALRRILT